MKKYKWMLVLFCAFSILACTEKKQSVPGITQGETESHPSPSNTNKKIKIALVMKTLTNPFFIEMEKGARRAQQEKNIDLLVKTATQETSIEQQIQIVEEFIDEKVDAIVIAPGDSTRIIPVLKKAQKNGIVVVNVDNRISPEALKKNSMNDIVFISVDNENAAYMSAKYISEQVHAPTEAAIIEGMRSADNAIKRKSGSLRAFKENKYINVVAQASANWKVDEALALSKIMFTDHPNIRVVFCANDMMAIGVIEYLRRSHNKNVLVASFDALDEAKAAIKEGSLQVTVDQHASEQGYQGVLAAIRILNGEVLPANITVDAALVTKADFK